VLTLIICISFGCTIRRLREEQKINQEEAAERCGLHRTYYSGVERKRQSNDMVDRVGVCGG